jgi:hypothetical protein
MSSERQAIWNVVEDEKDKEIKVFFLHFWRRRTLIVESGALGPLQSGVSVWLYVYLIGPILATWWLFRQFPVSGSAQSRAARERG